MLLKIEGESVKVLKEYVEERPAVCEAADRVTDELHGFLMYKKMEECHKAKHPDAKPRYGTTSFQELTHMFLALSDMFSELLPLLNEEELEEFKKWKKSLEG